MFNVSFSLRLGTLSACYSCRLGLVVGLVVAGIRMQLVRLNCRYVKAVGVSAYCVLRITSWQAVLKAACGCSAYCVLRIASWRALPNAACGRPAYSAPVLRILLWAVLTTACVLRTTERIPYLPPMVFLLRKG